MLSCLPKAANKTRAPHFYRQNIVPDSYRITCLSSWKFLPPPCAGSTCIHAGRIVRGVSHGRFAPDFFQFFTVCDTPCFTALRIGNKLVDVLARKFSNTYWCRKCGRNAANNESNSVLLNLFRIPTPLAIERSNPVTCSQPSLGRNPHWSSHGACSS